MTDSLQQTVAREGHLTRRSRLLEMGLTTADLSRALSSGWLLPLCRDWVATDAAQQASVIAVAHRGMLTGPSALSSLGVWDATDRRIHVGVAPNARPEFVRLKQPIERFKPPRFGFVGFEKHWSRCAAPDPTAPLWRTSVVDALIVTSRVAAAHQFIACVDSALHAGAMRRSELAVLGECLSAERRGLLALVNPAAESGLESIARLLLRPLAHSVRPQVEIPGIGRYGRTGRVDLLLDNWLVIELDGDEFHDPRIDRDRNATLVRLGYRIHRFGYEQVINDWPLVEATVRALLAVPPGKEMRDSRGRISF